MAGSRVNRPPDQEDVDAFRPLGELHEYQETLAGQIRDCLSATKWKERRAVLWLPTGTGKTRVTVETLLMDCALEAPRNCILWVADRGELCEQAIETFRHVWMVRGLQSRSCRGGVIPTLRVIRLWGSREWQEPPIQPTVIVASIQTLARRLQDDEDFAEELAIIGERAAAIVFDEAHHVVAPSWGRVMRALGLSRLGNVYDRNQKTAAPLLGLTATPARTSQDETEKLSRRFNGRLLEPLPPFRALEGFQEGGYLAKPVIEDIHTGYELRLTQGEIEQVDVFHRLPRTALRRAASDSARTAQIVADLESRLDRLQSVLLFACSVEHAHTIAAVLARRGVRAAALDGSSPRPVRWRTIQRFREGSVQVLANYDLLATGFDAPNVDCVALARPVESRVLYAQMVGRGLRGPLNGGTADCVILDYLDRIPALGHLDDLRRQFRAEFLAPGDTDA